MIRYIVTCAVFVFSVNLFLQVYRNTIYINDHYTGKCMKIYDNFYQLVTSLPLELAMEFRNQTADGNQFTADRSIENSCLT